MKRPSAALALCAFTFVHPVWGAASNWPQFRGPNGAGVAETQKPPVFFGVASNALWGVALPTGHSSPCIWGDRIFLTAFATGKLETICVRRRDGHVLWRQAAPAEQIESFHDKDGSPAASTPATDGARVYVYFGSFGLLCYDVDGREKWRKPMPLPSTGGFGTGTSPVISDGVVVLNRDQNTNAHLLAVDSRTGRTLWKADRPDCIASYSTPLIWEHDTLKEVVLPGFLRVKSYLLKDGREQWLVRGLPGAVCTTPVAGDGLLFVAAWSNGSAENPFPPFEMLLASADKNHDGVLSKEEVFAGGLKDFYEFVDLNKDTQITRDEWDQVKAMAARGKNSLLAIRPGGTGDITDTHVAWSATKGLPYVPSPLYYRGRIYLVKDGGLASCYDAKSGQAVYTQERLGVGGAYFASPVAADGRIYITSNSGAVVVLAVGETLNVMARNELGERIFATPAIVENKLYVRTANHLYAFGE